MERIEFHAANYLMASIAVAVVCAPTGVYCAVQAGGLACDHPKCEGYPLPLMFLDDKDVKAIRDFDDCKWGCWGAENDRTEEYLEKYAESIDALLNNHVNNNCIKLTFSFDRERIKEVQEGWWPVYIQFIKNWHSNETYEKKFKGYLHFGNCD